MGNGQFHRGLVIIALAIFTTAPAFAGPPYVTDDPEPTETGHFEIYAFAAGTQTQDGNSGAGGIDFNYGAAPDVQLTVTAPIAFDDPHKARTRSGFGNLELAVKYRFLHQADVGWDVAVFPRLFLQSGSRNVGEHHASLLVPIWLGRDWGNWSTFGGGGCAFNNSGASKNYCQAGWALTRQITPHLNLGAEIYYQTADSKGSTASTALGFGMEYDFNENYHVLASIGPGIQNAGMNNQMSWYTSILFTF